MKKLIFKNIFTDVIYFFLITSLSLTLVVWVIQAVNLLDLVSEDGHGFKLYFIYTLLILPKIFTKLIIFLFFLSTFYVLNKYEENNEILIFWTFGVNKLEFIRKECSTEYPNLCENLKQEGAKVELIDRILNNMFSDVGDKNLDNILSSIEATL